MSMRGSISSIRLVQQFSSNDAAVRLRIIKLISEKLANAHPDNIVELAHHITSACIRMYRDHELGPRGIVSPDNVFLGLGYEGPACYMAVLVNAPGAGAVRWIFRGDLRDIGELNEMSPQAKMDALEEAFESALRREFDVIRDAKVSTPL